METALVVFLSVLGTIVLFAGLAGGMALGLQLFAPRWSRNKRIGWATGLTVLTPMMLAFAGFFLDAAEYSPDGLDELVTGTLGLIAVTVILGVGLCLPSAWYVTSRLDRSQGDLPLLDHDGDKAVLIGSES